MTSEKGKLSEIKNNLYNDERAILSRWHNIIILNVYVPIKRLQKDMNNRKGEIYAFINILGINTPLLVIGRNIDWKSLCIKKTWKTLLTNVT